MDFVEQPIIVKVKLESNDFVKFNTTNIKSKGFIQKALKGCLFYIVLFFIILTVLLWFSFQAQIENPSKEIVHTSSSLISILPTIVIVVFGILLLILFPILVKKSAKKNFESNKIIQKEIEYSFYNDGIKGKSESFEFNFKWEEVFKVVELDSYFGFYESNRSLFLVPKRFFPNEESVIELRKIIISKMPFSKYEIINKK